MKRREDWYRVYLIIPWKGSPDSIERRWSEGNQRRRSPGTSVSWRHTSPVEGNMSEGVTYVILPQGGRGRESRTLVEPTSHGLRTIQDFDYPTLDGCRCEDPSHRWKGSRALTLSNHEGRQIRTWDTLDTSCGVRRFRWTNNHSWGPKKGTTMSNSEN